VKVVYEGKGRPTHLVASFDLHGVVYGSLKDLSDALLLRTYYNSAARKLEVKGSQYRVKVSANNPFVVISDKSNNLTTYQLPLRSVLASNEVFVPVQFFLPLANVVCDGNLSYDMLRKVITVKSTKTEDITISRKNPFDISDVQIEERKNGYLIRMPTTRKFTDFESFIGDDGTLYTTIASAKADVRRIELTKPVGIIGKVEAIQSPTALQLNFHLSRKVESSDIFQDQQSNDLLIPVYLPMPSQLVDSIYQSEKQKSRQPEQLGKGRKDWKLDCIVIDPGHGGRSVGTIGLSGVYEKKIALSIALKLGKLIEKDLKGVKVVYTRKNDRNVELYRRGQIANEVGAKLFISIHCNSMPRKPNKMNGFEVYLLRPGRVPEAIAIAEQENSVIKLEEGYEKRPEYKELTDENFILVTMAHSAYMKYSERFAQLLQEEMKKSSGVRNNGVKQAGFYVLVGASMPSVLVETAYLSNKNDEKFLKSSSGQQAMASSVFKAIKKYKTEYERTLQEGK
jgi:N-acetylmuramoyl-L-alanine amidase